MNLKDLTENQKENLYITFDNIKYCLFCKESFGFTFLGAFNDSNKLQAHIQKYKLMPKMDYGASMQFLIDTGVVDEN